MIETLRIHVRTLAEEIRDLDPRTDAAFRAERMSRLVRKVQELEARGGCVPVLAVALVRGHVDADVEDSFDNMPV